MANKKIVEEKPKRKVASTVDIEQTCKDCGVKFMAHKVTYDDGSVIITPPRCVKCQTAYVTDMRVNKCIKDIMLVGNLKLRLSNKEREAVMVALTNALQGTIDRFNDVTTVSGGFSLKHI